VLGRSILVRTTRNSRSRSGSAPVDVRARDWHEPTSVPMLLVVTSCLLIVNQERGRLARERVWANATLASKITKPSSLVPKPHSGLAEPGLAASVSRTCGLLAEPI
jgi:hypothetical protein